MNDPVAGVKYRIQHAYYRTYIELTKDGRVGLRGEKASDLQYWQFDVDPSGYHYIRSVADNNKRLSLSDFVPSSAVISAVWLSYDSTYRLTAYQPSYITLFVYASEDDPTLRASTWTAEYPLTGADWLLVPVTSSQICSNPLPPGNYRVRNYNGNSLLTIHHTGHSIGQGVASAHVYVRSQHHESPYQRWTVTPQQSGQYIIQNAGNNSYLGYGSSTPVVGDSVVQSRTAHLWDVRNIGGLAWSIRVPSSDISIGSGVPMKDGDNMRLVSSNFTPSQIWFFESYFPFGRDEIYAKQEVPEGKYLLQNVVRHANWNNAPTYMNAVSTPWRISPGSDTTCKFALKYIDNSSPNFTLTYVTNTTESLVVADVGGYIGFSDTGTEFVLLERNQGDPGYVICRPDSGHPIKVVSGRITTDLSNNSVFSIENQAAGDTYQMWLLVPTY
ncbi:hypothetical protein APHAL10511_004978 [Amanita phalloides]|nr:hypothetical protein APHAL10511_004978 [Amanita phalloides]